MERDENSSSTAFEYLTLALFVVEAVILIFLKYVMNELISSIEIIFIVFDVGVLIYLIYLFEREKKSKIISVSRVVGKSSEEALLIGEMGIVYYDEDNSITWVSELFENRDLSIIGQRVTKAIPGSDVLIKGDSDSIIVTLAGRSYLVSKNEDERILYLKDITELSALQKTYEDEKLVLGLIHLDNYSEVIQYEDEQKIALINTNIRQKIIEWANDYGAAIRRIRSDRFFIVLDQASFTKMLNDKFTILNIVKENAEHLQVAITASISMAYGSTDIQELNAMINDGLELVTARGGDQAAVQKYNEEVKFYGTSSQTSENSSKIRARVMAQTIKGIIKDSDNVFLVPHKDADYDAIGACIGMSLFAQACGKNAYIVLNVNSIEPSAKRVLEENEEILANTNYFIDEETSLDILTNDAVVIVCDHHSADITIAPRLVEEAKKIAIIDHHRRKQETNITAMMIYNEPAASSTVELIIEMMQYQPLVRELSEIDATFMYTGILVDTDGFKARCSSRTFEACAYLRKKGADITLANEWLKETIEQFEMKNKVLKYAKVVHRNIFVAAMPESEGTATRTLVSQVANYALTIKDIEASFVVAKIDNDLWSISGRSNGEVNVQLIIESMGGGGHFNAAGLQRKESSVNELYEELIIAIDKYFEETETNESNITK